MDAQIPFHHAEFINKCLTVCDRLGIRQMILGGDALDINTLNAFAPNFENNDKRVIDTKLPAPYSLLQTNYPATSARKSMLS